MNNKHKMERYCICVKPNITTVLDMTLYKIYCFKTLKHENFRIHHLPTCTQQTICLACKSSLISVGKSMYCSYNGEYKNIDFSDGDESELSDDDQHNMKGTMNYDTETTSDSESDDDQNKTKKTTFVSNLEEEKSTLNEMD
jgi:hypothetical protein